MRLHAFMWLPAVGAVACWGGEPWTPSEGATPWRPTPDAPAGWTISTVESALPCPDGSFATATLLAPADPGDRAWGVALVVPDGSFDYPLTPNPDDPLSGPSYQQPTRLDAAWGRRHAWAIAGMYRSGNPDVDHDGSLALALTRHDLVVVVPDLCWGDYAQGSGESADGVSRYGSDMVGWLWEVAASEPEVLGLAATDPTRSVLVALGEGGRGAAEALRTQAVAPSALLVDSADDDMDVYWDDRGAWAERIEGLERIYPGGAVEAASKALSLAPLPDRVALVWSSSDPHLAAGTIDALRDRITTVGGRVVDTEAVTHVQLAHDPALADDLVGWMLGEGDPDP